MTNTTLRQTVRLLVPDKRKVLRNIQIGVGDGNEDIFRVPVLTVDTLDSGDADLTVSLFNPNTSGYVDGVISNFDYETGDVQLSAAPEEGIVVIAYFSYITFTDAEIDLILVRTEIASCPYLCAAFLVQSILADTSRFVSFTQGDARYSFDNMTRRLEGHIERLWKQSPLTADTVSVPFNPDVLSRIQYETPPIVRATTPQYRF